MVGAALLVLSSSAVGASVAPGESTPVRVHVGQRTYQRIDGFGFSQAFQTAQIAALSPKTRGAVLRLLMNRTTGAGLDIVRFGLGGAGTVRDQLALGKAAKSYGITTFYAAAWSAPASMKTNRSLTDGGYLCGVPGESCKSGDARKAYAEYLAKQAKGFKDRGLPLKTIDFVNEPEITNTYPSMLMTPAQAADFIPFLAGALKRQHLSTTIACCDAVGWATALGYTQAVLGSAQAAPSVGLITAHGYAAPPTFPLTSSRRVSQTEWSSFDPWDPAWDDGSPASGLTWANNIYTALTKANVSSFLYWWGAFTEGQSGKNNEGLIKLGPGRSDYQISGRLWAFAAFSRFVRPGARRLATDTSDPQVDAVAFKKAGKEVLVVINNSRAVQRLSVQVGPGISSGTAQPYLRGPRNTGTKASPARIAQGTFTATVPARSLVPFVLIANA